MKFEIFGTFILVFFGLGAVAVDVTSGGALGLSGVAIVWGLALMMGIYSCGSSSGAHFNPSITIAMCILGKMNWSKSLAYILAQFIGAALAAMCVFMLFSGFIKEFEVDNGITRGEPGSEASAMIFGEYFPNPNATPFVASNNSGSVTPIQAFGAEFLGTLFLAAVVFNLTDNKNLGRPKELVAFAIGGALTALICVFGPLTMAGFNPARDFAPRIISSFLGWGSIPFTVNSSWWFAVYGVAPILGAICGGGLSKILFNGIKEPEESVS